MNLRTVFLGIGLTFLFSNVIAQCHASKKSTHHVKTVSHEHQPDIVTLAAGIDDYSTLVTAIKTAELVSTLQGDGPFTVFAPKNSAFSKLPEGTVGSLLKPENKSQLQKVLTYHVVSGEFLAKDIINAVNNSDGNFEVETVSGGRLKASLSNDTLILTDEKGNRIAVTDPDVKASNGIIHVIDGVLLPK